MAGGFGAVWVAGALAGVCVGGDQGGCFLRWGRLQGLNLHSPKGWPHGGFLHSCCIALDAQVAISGCAEAYGIALPNLQRPDELPSLQADVSVDPDDSTNSSMR